MKSQGLFYTLFWAQKWPLSGHFNSELSRWKTLIGRSFQAGDVLIYIANDYGVTLGRICDELKNRGIIVLPVYVGKFASLSQLSHLAETQFTGKQIKYIMFVCNIHNMISLISHITGPFLDFIWKHKFKVMLLQPLVATVDSLQAQMEPAMLVWSFLVSIQLLVLLELLPPSEQMPSLCLHVSWLNAHIHVYPNVPCNKTTDG